MNFIEKHKDLIIIIRTLLVGAAAALIGIINATFSEDRYVCVAFQKYLISLINGGWLVGLYITPLLIVFLTDIIMYISKKNRKLSSSEFLKPVVVGVNEIVSTKLGRFKDYSPKKEVNPFVDITQPELQIKEIVLQFFNTVKALVDDDIKVLVAKCKDGQIVETVGYHPKGSYPTIMSNPNDGTFLSFILQSKRAFTIENLKKERDAQNKAPKKKRRFKFNNEKTNGSIAGYPIFKHTSASDVDYVLTVKTTNKLMNKNFCIDNEIIFDTFSKRIQIETELSRIKTGYLAIAEGTNAGKSTMYN